MKLLPQAADALLQRTPADQFLPELADRAGRPSLKSAFILAVTQSRPRRDELELLAYEHQVSAAGDDCQSMRRLIRKFREALSRNAWHFPGDEVLGDLAAALHRLQLLSHSVARTRKPAPPRCQLGYCMSPGLRFTDWQELPHRTLSIRLFPAAVK